MLRPGLADTAGRCSQRIFRAGYRRTHDVPGDPFPRRFLPALVCGIVRIWKFALLLTSLAPIISGRFIFLRAGVWVS
jgi:hypothetical protein